DYKTPLTSGDEFWVGLNTAQSSKLRFDFLQDIIRSSDDKLVLKARITGTAVNERGRPFVPDSLSAILD
ncbi:MAG: acyl-CoA thioesterase, partial [Thioalkalispiraceae bacterium]